MTPPLDCDIRLLSGRTCITAPEGARWPGRAGKVDAMTEVEFSKLLSNLTKTAEALNQKSDSINQTIGAIETRLREINVGIETWLFEHPIKSRRLFQDQDGDEIERGTRDEELGFAKLEDGGPAEWRFVVRSAEYANGDSCPTLKETGNYRLLRDCSRKMRIAGLERIPRLIALMDHEASEAVRAIDDAKKLVK